MTCHSMETDYRSGRRFIPARRTDGELWLDTEHVADTYDEALGAARLKEWARMLPEWVEDAPLVGIVEVDMKIVGLHALDGAAVFAARNDGASERGASEHCVMAADD